MVPPAHGPRDERDELYEAYLRVPPHQRAEIVHGTLYVMSRPSPKHANAASTLGVELGAPFQRGRGGPGGWWILDELELQLIPKEPVVPDLAGWRLERMPELPDTAYFTLAPDWVCDPPFRALVEQLYGLHHVRFLTLGEIAVYCVLMQRTPVSLASAYKRRFLARFGIPVEAGGVALRAMPELDELVELDAAAIAEAIGHARKAAQIAAVVRGVAAIGERFLRTAPYPAARDALLAIPGIGPFSAAAILLRGLGRMDELPPIRQIEDDARWLYGAAYDAAAIARRYGAQIGYWSFYLRTGAGRARRAAAAAA